MTQQPPAAPLAAPIVSKAGVQLTFNGLISMTSPPFASRT